MNLSKFFIDRPIFAGVLSLLMLIAAMSIVPSRSRTGSSVARGFRSMTPGSFGSNPSTMSDGPSQTKLIQRICATNNGVGQPNTMASNTPSITHQ